MTETVSNPFATPEGARRYRHGRPFHHPRALDRILSVVGMESVGLALDVACGTGLSTSALADRARAAIGVDSVEAMVRIAKPVPNALYALAAAERLPFGPETFDLLTVSSGVHWFDQEAFFAEAARVLTSQGWLAIYDHFFEGSDDEPAIDTWLERQYARRYPPPPRAARADRTELVPAQFDEVESFEYDDPIAFTHDQLVSYLLSQSNTIVPATEGRERPEETESWLRTETARWFDPRDTRTFKFRAAGRCFRLRS